MEEIKKGEAEENTTATESENNEARAAEDIRKKAEDNTRKLSELTEALNKMVTTGAKGTMRLFRPIQDGDRTYEEIKYDFMALTGQEIARAMDDGKDSGYVNSIGNDQALRLFAMAAEKQTGGLDRTDITTRMGGQDAIKAMQIAKSFFYGTSRVANGHITNDA